MTANNAAYPEVRLEELATHLKKGKRTLLATLIL